MNVDDEFVRYSLMSAFLAEEDPDPLEAIAVLNHP